MNDIEKPYRLKIYTPRQLSKIEQVQALPEDLQFSMKVVSMVLPFRVNNYVIEKLIDWDNIPDDPIFKMTFPQRDMIGSDSFSQMADLVKAEATDEDIRTLAVKLRRKLNPHPAGQMDLNVVKIDNSDLKGIQHKYHETLLFFPRRGQVCHSFCTFCFRWAQFVGDEKLKIATEESKELFAYLRQHKEVTDLLITGGDPMVMSAKLLRNYIEPISAPALDHVQNIRIGTKALTFWPQRFVTDSDSGEILKLFVEMIERGKHIAIMAHFNHWREMETPICREAIRRIRGTGAEIRCQGPLVAHINDDPEVWNRMWKKQVELGMIPYYMFIERNTGAHTYFEVPLYQALEIYRQAIKAVSGLARTVRGPSMSCGPGKIEIQGIAEVNGEKVFVLRFIQARNPDWVNRPFFAEYSEDAKWINHLKPAFGKDEFFFEDEYRKISESSL